MVATRRPATGVAKWVGRNEFGERILRIHPKGGRAQDYDVEEAFAGFRLHYLDRTAGRFEVVTYHVNLVLETCTCRDHRTRPGACKHVRALKAATGAK